MGGACRMNGRDGQPKSKRPVGMTRSRLENNIRKILEKWGRTVWTGCISLRVEICVRLL